MAWGDVLLIALLLLCFFMKYFVKLKTPLNMPKVIRLIEVFGRGSSAESYAFECWKILISKLGNLRYLVSSPQNRFQYCSGFQVPTLPAGNEESEMSVSRRMFLSGSVATAITCASAPLAALGVGRLVTRENGLPNKSRGGSDGPDVRPHAPLSPELKYQRLANIPRNAFESAIGSAFMVSNVSGKGQPFWVRLLSVKDLAAAPAANPASMAVPPPAAALQSPPMTAFNLAFSGGPLRNFQQQTFIFQHAELGQFALFIVPAGPQQYTAMINRLQLKTVIPV
jgi:hypothetical protein